MSQIVFKRLRSVVIECRPAIEVIRDVDRQVKAPRGLLIDCDPPYLPETRNGGAARTYAHEMTVDDHAELLEVLLGCRGAVVLSGYPNELCDRRLAGWRRREIPTKSQASNSGGDRTEV